MMQTVLVPLEMGPGETRVASTPDVVKRLQGLGFQFRVERGAGEPAGFSDQSYADAGAELVPCGDAEVWRSSQVLLTLGRLTEQSSLLQPHSLVIGQLAPHGNLELHQKLEHQGLSAISLELLPRISRAQAMDVLSSQANIAGYKAVLLAATSLDRFMPMLMTAAGTVQPARVLVIGAGVAGLQAVATARRLGAVVSVSDVRAAAREQVESLGARFIPPPEQGKPGEQGGYAKEATAAFLEAQRQGLANHLGDIDVVICTAQVPGKPAPMLLTTELTGLLHAGAVVVDLAAAQGGNCELSRPGETISHNGVSVIGASNLPASVPHHASSLFARNLQALLEALMDKEANICLDPEDALLAPSLISLRGELRRLDLIPERQNNTKELIP
jgi:NAD(P) transhydrogenase subunit alpha